MQEKRSYGFECTLDSPSKGWSIMGTCSVSFGMEAEEMCAFWEAKIKRARKVHTCEECRKPINIGDRYESLAYVFDGSFNHEKKCLICAEIRDAFLESGSAYCPGYMWTDIRDYVFPEMTTACFDRLKTPEAKAELQRRWMEWKGF
jgi:hypothetical protein